MLLDKQKKNEGTTPRVFYQEDLQRIRSTHRADGEADLSGWEGSAGSVGSAPRHAVTASGV